MGLNFNDLPTKARITVSKDAAGNDAVTLNSSIWKTSTETVKKNSIYDLIVIFNNRIYK